MMPFSLGNHMSIVVLIYSNLMRRRLTIIQHLLVFLLGLSFCLFKVAMFVLPR